MCTLIATQALRTKATSKFRKLVAAFEKASGKNSERYAINNTVAIHLHSGWVRCFVVVCDFKLFLYDLSTNSEMSSASLGAHHGTSGSGDGVASGLSNVTPFVSVNTLIDMR